MMHTFIANNRAELIERCRAKVARRAHRAATHAQMRNGIPMFLDQLQRTLEAEEGLDEKQSLQISGPAGGAASSLSEIGVSATAHGKQLLELDFTVDQVVHDYGDLCQAITDLAVERDAPFGVGEFRTLNRCLDNAIADAVTEFSYQKDVAVERQREFALRRRIGSFAHELRNALSSATLALAALETGGLPVNGATGGVLKRSLGSMTRLIHSAVEEVREGAVDDAGRGIYSLDELIADAASAARLYASTSGCALIVPAIDPEIELHGDRERILAALANLLQNAFKFTARGTDVTLGASAYGSSVHIEVSDHCGGLASGSTDRLFSPFTQRNTDRSGLGLGLSIARQSVEADGGTLSVRNRPGHGCTFVVTLPRHHGTS
jgi:hypothetical protein